MSWLDDMERSDPAYRKAFEEDMVTPEEEAARAKAQALAGLERLRQSIEALPDESSRQGGTFVLAVMGTIRRWLEEAEEGKGPINRDDAAGELMAALMMAVRSWQ